MATIGYHIQGLTTSQQSQAVSTALKYLKGFIRDNRLEGYSFELLDLGSIIREYTSKLSTELEQTQGSVGEQSRALGNILLFDFNPYIVKVPFNVRDRLLLQSNSTYQGLKVIPGDEYAFQDPNLVDRDIPVLTPNDFLYEYKVPKNVFWSPWINNPQVEGICFTVLFTTVRTLSAGTYNAGMYDLIVYLDPRPSGDESGMKGESYFKVNIGPGFTVATSQWNGSTDFQPTSTIQLINYTGSTPVSGLTTTVTIQNISNDSEYSGKEIAQIVANAAGNTCNVPPPVITGCTDSKAVNYNPAAVRDDGSCRFIEGCTDPTALNYNPAATKSTNTCQYGVRGCTDPEAQNYNPLATQDDGSCRRTRDRIAGCTDPAATNYNPAATEDNGTCKYVAPVEGCTDPSATNYNPDAVRDNGTCLYIEGCLDPEATNYNPRAVRDNGSCRYNEGCLDPKALNYNPNAIRENGTCRYGVEVRFKTIVRPSEANTPELKKARIVVSGKEIGTGQATAVLERGLSYRVEFIAPEHPDYVFNAGVPPSIDFTIPATPTPGERLEYVSVFTGIKLPSCFLNVTANYVPPITDKSLLGGVVLNGVAPVELNKITETFDPATQTVLLSTGDNRVRLRVPPGVYTIAFKDVNVPGMVYTTPPAFVTRLELGQTINETRTYLGKPLPPVYWLRPIDDSETQQINYSTIVGMFSDNISNLTTFFTSSNTDELDNYYTHVNHKSVEDKTSEIQFSLAYGHILGSGSNGPEGQYNDSPTRGIYAQYRNLILGTSEGKFNLAGTEIDHFYVISYQKDRRYAKADYNALEINLAHLSGSEFINGIGYMAAHTGSNVTLGGQGKVLRLITDSKFTDEKYIGNAGVEYNIVSGSIEDGIFNPQNPHYYGKIYPSLGAVLLDANKLDLSASFGTVTSRELNGMNQMKLFTAISGAADFTDLTGGDYLGMKARAVKEEMVNHYFLNVKSKEYNFTNNPSYRNLTTGEIEEDSNRRAKPYITTLGLYDDQRNLVAVVKLKDKLKKTFADEVTFNVRLKI